jgi:hypothetical protein
VLTEKGQATLHDVLCTPCGHSQPYSSHVCSIGKSAIVSAPELQLPRNSQSRHRAAHLAASDPVSLHVLDAV